MTSEQLKLMLNADHIINILTEIGCHSIKPFQNVIVCANKDGDNVNAINVFTDNFLVKNYTRSAFESRPFRDIITLVEYVENIPSQFAIKRICDICGFNYYEKAKRTPKVLKWLSYVESTDMTKEDEGIVVLPERVLNQFTISPVGKWHKEGIALIHQEEFQIGFDTSTERIVIPIRDEIGSLIGVKGRLLKDEQIDHDKYIYLYNCPKNKVLYGLYQNYKYIKEANEVIVVEGEKSVLKLRSIGFDNAVAIGGKMLSKHQRDKLLRLGVPITIALDKDVSKEEIELMVNELKYPVSLFDIKIIRDDMNLLSEKESPADDVTTWEVLYSNFRFTA